MKVGKLQYSFAWYGVAGYYGNIGFRHILFQPSKQSESPPATKISCDVLDDRSAHAESGISNIVFQYSKIRDNTKTTSHIPRFVVLTQKHLYRAMVKVPAKRDSIPLASMAFILWGVDAGELAQE